MTHQTAEQSAQQRLATIEAPWVTGVAGLAIIGTGLLISIVNAGTDTPNRFISMTLQPFIFVGLGLLLYHVGQHVHAMNQNVILMVRGTGSGEHDAPGAR